MGVNNSCPACHQDGKLVNADTIHWDCINPDCRVVVFS